MDKIKFAQLIGYITRVNVGVLSEQAIAEIDKIITEGMFPKAVEVPGKIDENELRELLAAMKMREKIEVIRCYRQITGKGLKESKEIIEMYMPDNTRAEAKVSELTAFTRFVAESDGVITKKEIQDRAQSLLDKMM